MILTPLPHKPRRKETGQKGFVLDDELKDWLRTNIGASRKQLWETLGVSKTTLMDWLKQMHLTGSKKAKVERKENKEQVKQVKQKVEQLAPSVTEIKELQDNFLAIMNAPTGKDFNGIPLRQFDKFAITMLQNSDNPKFAADARAIYGDSMAKDQKQKDIEQRRKDGEVKRTEDRSDAQYRNMKKELQSMGCWFPSMMWDLKACARCKVDYDDAYRKRLEFGDTTWVPMGNGVMVEEKSIYYVLYENAEDRLKKALQKLSSGIEKYKRASGRNEEENDYLKFMVDSLNKIE